MTLMLQSVAMYSSWCFHQPSRTAFDCGEGLALALTSRIFALERVMLSHEDADHIGGLGSLIGLRAKTKGDREKPLAIYYPLGSRRIELLREYVAQSWPRLSYPLSWHPIVPGARIPLSRDQEIVAFEMHHRPNTPTLGYKLVETRRRLKSDYRAQVTAMPPNEVGPYLAAERAAGREVNEVYTSTPLAWCLDHWKLDPRDIADAELAIMDCTFLNDDDRREEEPAHATLPEVISTCVEADVKRVCLAHRSLRYHPDDLQRALDKLSPPSSLQIIACPTEGVLTI